MKNRVFHVISNTHWDREWRFPFQRNRQMLVDMIDRVLEILKAEPQYRAFHLDSQAIVLKDYLEVKPHKEKEIKKLVKEKRLLIGPWYILPEEFQVGGENLIRNLLLGHKTCGEYGGVSKIGYSPFSWGQISQLPQIYNQFGIELIMFYRGVNSKDAPKSEFLWIGADGTEAVSSRFSTMPRYNFYFYIYRPVVHNEGFYDVEYKWSSGGTPFHFADAKLAKEDYFNINPVDGYYEENIEKQVNAIINDQADDFTTEHVIWMEGHDSSGPNIKTVRIINDIKEKMPDVDVRHSTLEEYAEAVMKSIDKENLKRVEGERRSSQYDRRSGNLYGYTTSARMYLKQENYNAERWLQFYAEPFNIFSGLMGRDIKDNYPEIAWNMLIQNSAHDSIGGCSLDEIHEDMQNRTKQSVEISKGVFERSVQHIAKRIKTSALTGNDEDPDSGIFLLAVNPNNYTRNEVVKAYIDIPKEFDKGAVEITGADGSKVETQLTGTKAAQPVLEQMIDRPMYFDMQRYEVYLKPEDIPAFGYKSFKVNPVEKSKEKGKKIASKKELTLENEFLKVKVNKNGTFNVTVKDTNHTYKDQGYFYDEGESGHAWINIPEKPVVTTLKDKADIKVVENGPLSASIRIKHTMDIYRTLTDRKEKNKKKVEVPVTLTLTLTKGSRRLDMNAEVDNKAESHRLRMMFPSEIEVKESFGEGQFDVVARSTERPDTEGWIEQPMYDYPMHHFIDMNDAEKGYSVLVDGLKEYEVLDDKKNTLAITLFRAFEYVIQPSSKEDYSYQKGSQCLGRQTFRMAFYPHSGSWVEGEVYKEALNFSNHVSLAQTGSTNGDLGPENSMLKIEPEEIIFSALKKPEDKRNSFILRLYNPTDRDITGKVSSLFGIRKVEEVTLEEKSISRVEVKEKNVFEIEIEKKKIKTYKIVFEKI